LHGAGKVADVETLLGEWKGKELELLDMIEVKYLSVPLELAAQSKKWYVMRVPVLDHVSKGPDCTGNLSLLLEGSTQERWFELHGAHLIWFEGPLTAVPKGGIHINDPRCRVIRDSELKPETETGFKVQVREDTGTRTYLLRCPARAAAASAHYDACDKWMACLIDARRATATQSDAAKSPRITKGGRQSLIGGVNVPQQLASANAVPSNAFTGVYNAVSEVAVAAAQGMVAIVENSQDEYAKSGTLSAVVTGVKHAVVGLPLHLVSECVSL
jgi:hypothetical protein